MKKIRDLIGAFVAAVLFGVPAWGAPVTIFAASSLKTALDAVISEKNIDAVAVYGGSAAIARQVSQGAGADIVILAHPDWMDWLADRGLLDAQSRCDLLGNALVLAAPRGAQDFAPTSSRELIAALDGGRLAVGQLETVPAGQYAAAYLQGQGWLEALRPHLAQTSNVRLALALVARGETPLGLLYASDIAAQPDVRAVFVPAQGTYPEIHYPMALTQGADAAAKTVFMLLSDAQAVFERNGFSTLPDDDANRCNPA